MIQPMTQSQTQRPAEPEKIYSNPNVDAFIL